MRFIFHPEVRATAAKGLEWVRALVGRHDASQLGWVRIDLGREYRDRLGRRYRKYRGVYGRCWYPTQCQPTIRLSCQVPGPFPCDIVTRKRPVYPNPDGTWPPEARLARGPLVVDRRTGRRWRRVYGATRVMTREEGVVWVFAHEAFHWLKKTGQLPGRNDEIQADAYADGMLAGFRAGPAGLPGA